MAITLGVYEAYVSIADAAQYLTTSTEWAAASDDTKTDALVKGRYFIDGYFTCDLSDYDEVPEELEYANALLANDFVVDESVFDSTALLASEYVKADTVETKEEYVSGKKNFPESFNIVKSILQDLCAYKGSQIFLLRG